MFTIGMLILALIVIILVGGVAMALLASRTKAVPTRYWEKLICEFPVESKYNPLGSYITTSKQYPAPADPLDEEEKYYQVYSPVEKGQYPCVILVNGTGVSCNKYEDVFNHMASHGYVVVGNNYGTNWDGKYASQTLDFVLSNPEVSTMIDQDKIAIGGHDQGAVGVINAITDYENGKLFKCAYLISLPNKDMATEVGWNKENEVYDESKVECPVLLFAGDGPFESTRVAPLENLQESFSKFKGKSVLFRMVKNDHGEVFYKVNGYVLAWLDAFLKEDEFAMSAFYGEEAELKNHYGFCDYMSK